MNSLTLSRRRLLTLVAAGSANALPRVVPTVLGVALLGYAPTASAYVQVALAAASVVSNMIASSQKGDGGIGATLQATLQYQRVMSEQLTSIQTGLAEVLKAVQNMEKVVRDQLQESRAKQLITGVEAQVKNYRDEYARFVNGQFVSLEDWMLHPLTKPNLLSIDQGLRTAVNSLEAESFIGPLAALQLPVAMFTALAVRTALGESDPARRVLAQGYLDRFAACSDASRAGSTAAEMRAALDRYKQSLNRLGDLGVSMTADGNLSNVEIVNLKRVVECSFVETEPPGDCRSNCSSTEAYWDLYSLTASLRLDNITGAAGAATTIRPVALDGGTVLHVKSEMRHSKKGKGDTPFPGIPTIYLPATKIPGPDNTNLPSCGGRDRQEEKFREAFKSDISRVAQVKEALNIYNANLAYLGLCSSALAGLLVARQSVLRAFGRA